MKPWKTLSAFVLGRPRVRRAFCYVAAAALIHTTAAAQENVIGPPDILQYPVEASPQAQGALEVASLRKQIESGADLAFCETLMRQASKWPPTPSRDFMPSDCLPEFKSKVAANEGIVHWESDGSRPTNCGLNCVSRPFLNRTYNVGRPNFRRASLHGYLNLFLEPPGDHVPNNRSVSLPFDAFFGCATANGARNGTFRVEVDFGFPIVGDPGFWENVINVLLAPANVSERTESGIRKQLSNFGSQTASTIGCASIGASRPADSADDKATFDFPAAGRAPTVGADVAQLRDQATIELLRIKRNPLPGLIAPEIARPGDPAAGQFSVFLNGLERFLPPEGLALPPEGGSAGINYCMTVDLTGADRLQIIFANALGGSVWSQFYPNENFGAGQPQTMTTGRTVVVPGMPRFDPITGRTEPAKPEARLLTEFELLYRITYTPRPNTVAPPSTGGVRPGLQDVTGIRPGQRPQVGVDPTAAPQQPCRKI
jgi:hypothetical protein